MYVPKKHGVSNWRTTPETSSKERAKEKPDCMQWAKSRTTSPQYDCSKSRRNRPYWKRALERHHWWPRRTSKTPPRDRAWVVWSPWRCPRWVWARHDTSWCAWWALESPCAARINGRGARASYERIRSDRHESVVAGTVSARRAVRIASRDRRSSSPWSCLGSRARASDRTWGSRAPNLLVRSSLIGSCSLVSASSCCSDGDDDLLNLMFVHLLLSRLF